MPRDFRRYEPDQSLLLPPSLRDWLPEDHLAHFVSDAIEAMDLSAFDARYGDEGPGNQAFDPRMMLKVLVYAYATGTFSSRKIAAKLHEDVAFRLLAADNFPSHRTIAGFRQRHVEEFRELFVQLVQMAREAGLVKLGTVAIDGSKVRANASKRKAMTYKRMKQEEKRLRQEIRKLMDQAGKMDAVEDQRYGKDRRGNELPKELADRQQRLATIQAAKKRLAARQREADEKNGREPGDQDRMGQPGRPFKRAFGEPEQDAQDNFTDPESRIMKSSSIGFQQAYNVQTAVDGEDRLIVATAVTQSASDVRELVPLVEAVKANTGASPESLLGDAGYRSEANLQFLEDERIDGYIAFGREGKSAKEPDPDQRATVRMFEKMKTKRARDRYRKRKHLAEPPFGWIKSVLGFDRFSLRGLTKVTGEWDLICLAANLKRLNGKLAWT
jgi:transposase